MEDTATGVPRIGLKAYGFFSSLLRNSRLLEYRVGRRTLRGHLTVLSWGVLHRTLHSPMMVHGLKMHVHLEPGSAVPLASESYEPETTRLVLSALEMGQTFVDVGAHVGYYTLLAARAVGSTGRVYAFEPAPDNLSLLSRNIQVNGCDGNVTLVPKAVSDKSGHRPLFLSEEDSGTNSIFPSPLVRTASVDVETTTLDAYFEQEGWPPIHLMKMDIEGGEKAALEGMGGLSRRNPSLKLILEFGPSNLAAGAISPDDLFQSLRGLGFVRLSIISWKLIPVETPHQILKRMPRARNLYVNLLCEK